MFQYIFLHDVYMQIPIYELASRHPKQSNNVVCGELFNRNGAPAIVK